MIFSQDSRSAALAAILLVSGLTLPATSLADEKTEQDPLALSNLVAWCIVPFDAAKRGPKARAEMLVRLGLTRCAYDWRAEHVPTFEEEIEAYKMNGIDFFAFWGAHDEAFRLFEKHDLRPQIWQTAPSPKEGSQEERVQAAAEALLPMVRRTAAHGCRLGLYNHGGWGGEPENLVAVCRHLRTTEKAEHVGIVYNFHHGHEHLAEIERTFPLMLPYLLCVNLNGMNDTPDPKILPVGRGKHDDRVLKLVSASGYEGPIGILDHRNELDAEVSLRENLEGLAEWRADSAK